MTYDSFRTDVEALGFVDGLERIEPEPAATKRRCGLFDLLGESVGHEPVQHSASTKAEYAVLVDDRRTFDERWDAFQAILPQIKMTPTLRAIISVLRDLYGLHEFTRDEAHRVSEEIHDSFGGGFYSRPFENVGVRAIISCASFDAVPLFAESGLDPMPTVSGIIPHSYDDILQLERLSGRAVYALKDLVDIVERYFDDYHAHGVQTIKIDASGKRFLDFRNVRKHEAESALYRVLEPRNQLPPFASYSSRDESARTKDVIDLEVYLTRYMIQLAEHEEMCVAFNTGGRFAARRGAGAGNPASVSRLLFEFPSVPFVFLHSGTPFMSEFVQLCREFENCNLNLGWMHVMNPDRANDALGYLLETLPAHKVIGFGGDYGFSLSMYAYWRVAIENMASAFYHQVQQKRIEADEALQTMRLWFLENPVRLHRVADAPGSIDRPAESSVAVRP